MNICCWCTSSICCWCTSSTCCWCTSSPCCWCPSSKCKCWDCSPKTQKSGPKKTSRDFNTLRTECELHRLRPAYSFDALLTDSFEPKPQLHRLTVRRTALPYVRVSTEVSLNLPRTQKQLSLCRLRCGLVPLGHLSGRSRLLAPSCPAVQEL